MRTLRAMMRDHRGGIAIEFALVAPLLILVYIALSEMASAVMNHNRLAIATEVAAATLQTDSGAADKHDIIQTVYAAFDDHEAQRLNVAFDCMHDDGSNSGIAVLTVSYDMPSRASRLFGDDITLTVRRATPAAAICTSGAD